MTGPVRLDIDDDIATITMDAQHNRNALSRAMIGGLHDALDRSEAADARVVVLRHEGPAFCAGADLKEQADGPSDARPMVDVLRRLMDTERPTIAAVDGAVRAGGIGLMASCDLVVVRTGTTFALTEVRIGVAAAIISVPILRRVPAGRIAAAMLTGEAFGADEARSIGLVTHVADDVDAMVAVLCAGVLAGAPGAVRETKALLRTVPTLPRDEAFETMRELSERLFGGPEAVEGIAAFRERRSPDWTAVPTARPDS